uniref:Uncharacterized protein n=1 Tax=Arundo donax TaxID=35708 RepID=A0A0A9A6V6_ARUDO
MVEASRQKFSPSSNHRYTIRPLLPMVLSSCLRFFVATPSG